MPPITLQDVFLRLGIALALGLLVGIQRQRSGSYLAGFRTFPLVTLFGGLCALLAGTYGSWIVAAGIVALALTIGIGNVVAISSDEKPSPGITTEVALLLMFLIGAALIADHVKVSIVLGGLVAVLLQFKETLHGWAQKLAQQDLVALARFVLIALVVLPVLPDRDFGPFDVLNPYEIWWMVTLIVGIGIGGYVLSRLVGAQAGALLAGLLGGLISSTATTASFARRTRESPGSSALAAVVVLIASSVLYARVLAEAAAVAPGSIRTLAPPLAILLGVFLLLCFVAWLRRAKDSVELPPPENPAELRPALYFAFAYAAILVAVAATRHYFEDTRALYVVAAISGLTDVDAITLSTARLVESEKLDARTGWRLIVLASLSNLAFKTGMIAVLGDRSLLRSLGVWFGIGAAASVALLLLWP